MRHIDVSSKLIGYDNQLWIVMQVNMFQRSRRFEIYNDHCVMH